MLADEINEKSKVSYTNASIDCIHNQSNLDQMKEGRELPRSLQKKIEIRMPDYVWLFKFAIWIEIAEE